MKRLQVYLPENLLEQLRLYAQGHNMPLAEAIRRAGHEFIHKTKVKRKIRQVLDKKRQRSKNPLMAMNGLLKSGPANASTTIDDIYND